MDPKYPIDISQLDALQSSLEELIKSATRNDLYNETASGKPVANPRTSSARIPYVRLDHIPNGGEGKAALFGISREGVAVKDAMAQLQRANIDRILSGISLELPVYQTPLPPTPAPPVSPAVRLLQNVLRASGPALIIDLLTHHGGLNAGEDQRLAQYRADALRSSGGPR